VKSFTSKKSYQQKEIPAKSGTSQKLHQQKVLLVAKRVTSKKRY